MSVLIYMSLAWFSNGVNEILIYFYHTIKTERKE